MAHRGVRDALAGRGFVLFPAVAFAVHQLRYEIAYGSHADQALAASGHGYLDSLAPWVALAVALGFGSFLTRLAHALAGRPTRRPRRSFAALWGLAWLTLVASYSIQEWLEGMFAAGHPGGLEGIFGHGGLWAVPLAALGGLLVACLLALASRLIEVCAPRLPRRLVAPLRARLARPDSAESHRLPPLAARSAGRAPPARRPALFA